MTINNIKCDNKKRNLNLRKICLFKITNEIHTSFKKMKKCFKIELKTFQLYF